jgi:DNA-directed RNA polymerase subunit K/omega
MKRRFRLLNERLSPIFKRAWPYLPDVLVILLIAMVASAGYLFYTLITAGPAAPLKYTRDIYCAERAQQLESGCGPAVYAPGETLVYTASLEIQRAGALELVRGWRTNPSEARPRLCNGENAPVIHDVPPPFSHSGRSA